MRRILVPGGTVTLTVWSTIPPWAVAIADGLTEYVSAEAAKLSLGPFTFNDSDFIHGLLTDAGFSDIKMDILVVDRRIGPAEVSIPEEMASAAYADDVSKLDIETRTAMVKEIGDASEQYRVNHGFAIPQEAHLIHATA
jgi:hypothetical protein